MGRFDPADVAKQAEPVRRYFERAIAPGTAVARSAHVTMRGHIKIGRWLPFRAEEVLSPQRGFMWSARIAGLISGYDRYVDGTGSMTWKIAGLIPVMATKGADVSRSSAGRAGGEAQWLPTALLPQLGVNWTAGSPDLITVRYDVHETPVETNHHIDAQGAITSSYFERWGDPDRTGTWGWHRFGGEVREVRDFAGLCIPSEGRVGWHYATDRWPDGEFFRYRITDLRVIDDN